MRLSFNCPKCRKEYTVDDKLAGRKSRCSVCGETFRIPSQSAPTPRSSSASWDEPVAFFEVVEDDPPRSFKSAREEPVPFEEELPPPPRVAPIDFRKKPTAKKRQDDESPLWLLSIKILLGSGLGVLLIAVLLISTGLIDLVGFAVIAWGLVFLVFLASLVAMMVGTIGMLVLTARESIVCLLLSLFVPFYSLYYLITRWRTMRGPWGLSFSAYLVMIVMSLVMARMNTQRHAGFVGARVAAEGRPGVPVPPPPGAPSFDPAPQLRTAMAPRRTITLVLHGVPLNRDPAQGPRESDVSAAICERLKNLVPNCGAMAVMVLNGNVRITVEGSTTADALAAVINFGRSRANGDEVDVQVNPDFVESARGEVERAVAGHRRLRTDPPGMPPPRPQPAMAGDPAQAPGDASFPLDDPVARSLAEINGGERRGLKQAVERLARCAPDKRVGDVVRALVPLLYEDDIFLVNEVMRALAVWKSPDSVPPLIAVLKSDHHFVRNEAIKALGKIQDPRAVEPILELIRQNGREVEEALQDLGPAAEPALLKRIADPDRGTRERVLNVLAVVGGMDTLLMMQRMTPDPDRGIQEASKRAWRSIVTRVGPPPPAKKKR